MKQPYKVVRCFVNNSPDQFLVMRQKAQWGEGAICVCGDEKDAELIVLALTHIERKTL